MKRQLTVRFILILIAAYAALASVFPNIKAVAQETGDYVTAFDFSISAGKYATAHSSNWAVRIWDASNNQLLRTIQVHDPRRKFMGYASINNVVFSPSGDKLAITQWGDVPGLIIIVEASTGETLLEISGMPPVTAIDWSSDGKFLAGFYDYSPLTESEVIGHLDHFIALWDAETGEEVKRAMSGISPRSMAWNPSGANIIFPDSTRGVVVWDVESWQELDVLPAERAISVAWNPAEDTFASAGVDGVVHIWDGSSGELIREIKMKPFERAYPRVFWSQDGQVVGATAGNRIEAWESSTGRRVFIEEVSRQVTGVVLQNDGRIMVASGDRVVTLDTPLSESPGE